MYVSVILQEDSRKQESWIAYECPVSFGFQLDWMRPRLQAIQRALDKRNFSSSPVMTFAKPADSLKSAKIISRDEIKEPKWVQLEGEAAKWMDRHQMEDS